MKEKTYARICRILENSVELLTKILAVIIVVVLLSRVVVEYNWKDSPGYKFGNNLCEKIQQNSTTLEVDYNTKGHWSRYPTINQVESVTCKATDKYTTTKTTYYIEPLVNDGFLTLEEVKQK